MIPLTLAEAGKEQTIVHVGGNAETRQHLLDLGFNPGSVVTVVTTVNGSLIVNVKDVRIALDQSLASKVMV